MPRFLALLIGPVLLATTPALAQQQRPNILFIAVDDLRPALACYGQEQIHSPNIDRLAAGSMQFQRAYCMVPTCGASRASLITSVRPSRHRFHSYRTWAERDAPWAKPLHTQLEDHGYYTVSLGKILHNPRDHVEGWSERPRRPKRRPHYRNPKNHKIAEAARQDKDSPGRARGPAWESADVPDTAYADGRLARHAIQELRQLKKGEQPFFLAVGFFKPHLPFVAPQKYWDLYDHEKIHLPPNKEVPKNCPPQAIHNSGELRAYSNIPNKGPIPTETARSLIHGYYACVTYTDAQIGKVLDALNRLGLKEDTIVVLWSDHGWNLGEHTLWCKHCCFETSMRIPLLVRVPGMEPGHCSRLIESIDIYPTLCELTGIPIPESVQGRSFVPLLKDPTADWKDHYAVGRFGRGDTIRSDRYRFSEYTNGKGQRIGAMLYDHKRDPGETVNIVKKKEAAAARLHKALEAIKGRDREGDGERG